jgi:hypothetical protein
MPIICCLSSYLVKFDKSVKVYQKCLSFIAYHHTYKILTKSVNFLPIIILSKIYSNFVEINPFPLSSAIVEHDQAYLII